MVPLFVMVAMLCMVPSIVIVPLFVMVYCDNNNVSPLLIIRFVLDITVKSAVSVQLPFTFCDWYIKMGAGVGASVGAGVSSGGVYTSVVDVVVRYGPRPLMHAKYRAYDPYLMSTPCPAAEQALGRSRVTDVSVESAEAAKPPLQRQMTLLGWLPETSKHWLQ